jgi:hypothetical protein
MDGCAAVTAAAFEHLAGIHTLSARNCAVEAIVDEALIHLKGIHTLAIDTVHRRLVTDTGMAHLAGIHTLSMPVRFEDLGVPWEDDFSLVTEAGFAHLKGITSLCIDSVRNVSDAAFLHLGALQHLSMRLCDQACLTSAAFAPLTSIKTLDVSQCSQLTSAMFMHLASLEQLNMRECLEVELDARILRLVGRLKRIDLAWCTVSEHCAEYVLPHLPVATFECIDYETACASCDDDAPRHWRQCGTYECRACGERFCADCSRPQYLPGYTLEARECRVCIDCA